MSDLVNEVLGKVDKEIPEGICTVCGHKLTTHIDEGGVWRCHSLGQDFYQCECALRKDRAEGNIFYYDLKKRIKEQIEEGKS